MWWQEAGWGPAHSLSRLRIGVGRAFSEFLLLPTLIIGVFLLLALGTHFLDSSTGVSTKWLRGFLGHHLYASPDATRQFLSSVAGGIITIISITFSVLLLAVQQSATMMTNQVFDQFLHRRLNQIYIGFFIGLTLYTLIILATVHASFNPVYGATGALILSVAALYLLIVLIYSSINQMRPEEIIEAIHRSALQAREWQHSLLAATQRTASLNAPVQAGVHAQADGFVTAIDLRRINQALQQVREPVEIVFCVDIGSYVALHDTVATVVGPEAVGADHLASVIQHAMRLERNRDPTHDAAFAVEQIATIGWTAISTAKSNPAPGFMAIRNLRDLWARWLDEADEVPPAKHCLRVVYPDGVLQNVLDAFESLAVAASESLQHQSLAEIIHAPAIMVDRLPVEQRKRVEDISLRLLSSLGDHVLTRQLDAALSGLVDALAPYARAETIDAIKEAQHKLHASIGVLNARGTRASKGT